MRTVKLFIIAVIFVFLAVSTCFSADNEIILNYNFKQPVVGEVTIDSTVYNTVTISGLPNFSKTATPLLPVKGAKVYIPDGKKYISASVTWGNPQEIRLTHLIAPAQKPYPLSQQQDLLPTSPEQTIYSTDALYPSVDVKLVSQQGMCGYRIAILNLFPVRYNPVQNTLTYYSTAQLVVTLADVVAKPSTNTATISKRSDPADLNRVLKFVDNTKDVPQTFSQEKLSPNPLLTLNGPYEYVIITNQYLAGTPGLNNLEALAQHHRDKGMTAIVVLVDDPNTLKSIYANYPANPQDRPPSGVVDNQYKIRRFIQDAYNRWGTKYVLLAGDADGAYVGGETQEPIVPVRQLYDIYFMAHTDRYGNPYDDALASDLYYACLDGTFDDNANGYYGEYNDGPDLIAEVYVGRAPADSRDEISNFVRKTLDYEARKEARDPYLYNTQQAGEALGGVGYPYDPRDWKLNLATEDCNEIKKGSAKWSFLTNGFDDRLDNNATLYDYEFVDPNDPNHIRQCNCWPIGDLTDRINAGIHLINGDGHGKVDTLMKMLISDADSLTNNKYFIGTSVACYSGSFDNRDAMDPEHGCNCTLQYDSIAEHLVMGAYGAVALVVNSRYGWGSGSSTYGPSQFFSRNFWGAIFGKQIFGLGQANQYAKEEAIPFMDYGNYLLWCAYDLNLIGDPALEVFLPTILVPQTYTTIQEAITEAQAGDTIVVSAGTYVMNKAFDIDINKEIKLKSASGPTSTIIDCNGYDGCIKFSSVNNASLEGFTIKNNSNVTNSAVVLVGSNATVKNNIFIACFKAISLQGCLSPTIINNTITTSLGGAIRLLWSDSGPNTVGGTIENNIIGGMDVFPGKITKDANVYFNGSLNYNNVYGHNPYQGLIPGFYSPGLNPGSGSISEEPNFVSIATDDYHLNSLNSLCVDAGDASTFYDKEPMPNGSKINMGAYGGSFGAEATLNHKPVLNSIGNKTINVGNNLQFTVSATDPDYGDTIAGFFHYPDIAGASFNTTTGVFSWTPGCSQAGAYNITFRASDAHGMLSDPQTITITVGGNSAPVLAPVGYHSVMGCQGNIMYFYITATDSENNVLTFSASGLPQGAGFYQETPNRYRFGWVPRCDQLGSYSVTFTVTDTCGNQDFETVTLVVTDPNEPPPPPPPPCRPCSPYERKKGICVPCYVQ